MKKILLSAVALPMAFLAACSGETASDSEAGDTATDTAMPSEETPMPEGTTGTGTATGTADGTATGTPGTLGTGTPTTSGTGQTSSSGTGSTTPPNPNDRTPPTTAPGTPGSTGTPKQ